MPFKSVISAQKLQNLLAKLESDSQDSQSLVIIDCRFALHDKDWGKNSYQKSHIPGAFFLDLEKDLSSPVGEHGGRHPLPDIEKLAETFASLGIEKNKTHVVLYDDNRLGFCCRCWWLLRYLGHEKTSILDGGFSAWVDAGFKTSDQVPPQKLALFTPAINTSMSVELETVKRISQDQSQTLIDSREPLRYLGKKEPIDPVAGHIPSAINKSWQEITTTEGFIRPVKELKAHWKKAAPKNAVIYCGSGVTACVNIFALHLIGVNDAQLYVGSWSDWCSYPDNPIIALDE